MSKLCKNCRSYEPPCDKWDRGQCENPKVGGGAATDAPDACYAPDDDTGEGVTVYPGPDFGCVHWKVAP